MVHHDKKIATRAVCFMLRENIRGYDLRSNDKLKFECHKGLVLLEREHKLETITPQMLVVGQLESFSGIGRTEVRDKDDLNLTALIQKEVSQKSFQLLHDLAAGKIEPESPSFQLGVDVARSFKPFAKLELTNIHQSLKDLIITVKSDLDDTATRTFRILRWRTNSSGGYNHHGGCTYFFSFDGLKWHVLPTDRGVFYDIIRYIEPSTTINTEVVKLVDAGQDEPVGQSLYREAWRLRQSSPRSSIVMGISAAEIALKECIWTLQPETLWLLENLASPPIVQILTEYLPKLPITPLPNGSLPLPPDSIIKDIKKGVQIRNKLIHTGKKIPDNSTIGDILFAIEDLLWILEVCKGHGWAVDYIRDITKKEMKLI